MTPPIYIIIRILLKKEQETIFEMYYYYSLRFWALLAGVVYAALNDRCSFE